MAKRIEGFSKLSKEEKTAWIAENFSSDPTAFKNVFATYNHPNPSVQKIHD